MLGDSILVYSKEEDGFFAGWKKQSMPFSISTPKPIWSVSVDGAKVTRSLIYMQDVVELLGRKAKIVSETEARRIEALRGYKKAGANNGRGVKRGEGASK